MFQNLFIIYLFIYCGEKIRDRGPKKWEVRTLQLKAFFI